jgi:two-component system response regulator FlrC
MASHNWPGNVRELVNTVQRAVMLSDGEVIEPADLALGGGQSGAFEFLADDLPSPATAPDAAPHDNGAPAPPATRGSLVFDFEHGPHRAEDVERELVMQALRHTHGNVSRAAKLIGMQRSSLRYRIERYHLDGYVAEMANR